MRRLIEGGFIRQVLISQDAGWYHVGEPQGGNFRGYDVIFTRFMPMLREAGVSEAQIRMLMEENPRRALLPRVRRR